MTRRRSSHFENGVPMTPITPVARRGTAATTGTTGANGDELKAEESQAVADPEASVESTETSTELPYEPEPPPLNYTLSQPNPQDCSVWERQSHFGMRWRGQRVGLSERSGA